MTAINPPLAWTGALPSLAPKLSDAVAAITGTNVTRTDRLSGGSLSSVVRVTLDGGTTVVAKTAEGSAREARMLVRLAQAGVPVPRVLGHHDDVLVLEDLGAATSLAAGDDPGWTSLARALQPLHTTTGAHYGWPEDHAFGSVQIVNRPTDNWPEFWGQHRLVGPAMELAPLLRHRLERLALCLPDRLPTAPPAALLHGDLWVGNVLLDASKRAVLIDPACYYGDRRVDLAMLSFFASPPPAFHEATGTSGPDWPELCAIYQLWPALVHLRLFGRRYLGTVEQRLDRLGV